ncbi:tetratricopeptide repeat protein, partial [Myxococcota bacterium]|nr:tetratricopeptide repeat protein [Myxococcota bacterium]
MALNKNKVIAAAQRYIQKGQLDRAIKEYRSIVDEDPDDIRIWLKIGDLYVKKGAISQAVSTYKKVARFYTTKNFHLKAVAVYKQILNIVPAQTDAHLGLGQLYIQLGLIPDAVNQLKLVIGDYERNQKYSDSLELLKQIVSVQGEDNANRIRLAEAYIRNDEKNKAIEEFSIVMENLINENKLDDYIQVAERVLYIEPDEREIILKLSEIYIQRNQSKKALARLQQLFRDNPADIEVFWILANAFKSLELNEKAISIYKEIARINGEQGHKEASYRAWNQILGISPHHPEALEAIRGMDHQVKSGQPVGQRGGAGGNAGLSADVAVLLKYGLKAQALEQCDKALKENTQNVKALECKKTVLIALDRGEEAIEILFSVCELYDEDKAKVRGYLKEILELNPNNQRASIELKKIGAEEITLFTEEDEFVSGAGAENTYDPFGDLLSGGVEADPFSDLLAPAPAPTGDDFADLLGDALVHSAGSLAPAAQPLVAPQPESSFVEYQEFSHETHEALDDSYDAFSDLLIGDEVFNAPGGEEGEDIELFEDFDALLEDEEDDSPKAKEVSAPVEALNDAEGEGTSEQPRVRAEGPRFDDDDDAFDPFAILDDEGFDDEGLDEGAPKGLDLEGLIDLHDESEPEHNALSIESVPAPFASLAIGALSRDEINALIRETANLPAQGEFKEILATAEDAADPFTDFIDEPLAAAPQAVEADPFSDFIQEPPVEARPDDAISGAVDEDPFSLLDEPSGEDDLNAPLSGEVEADPFAEAHALEEDDFGGLLDSHEAAEAAEAHDPFAGLGADLGESEPEDDFGGLLDSQGEAVKPVEAAEAHDPFAGLGADLGESEPEDDFGGLLDSQEAAEAHDPFAGLGADLGESEPEDDFGGLLDSHEVAGEAVEAAEAHDPFAGLGADLGESEPEDDFGGLLDSHEVAGEAVEAA